MIVVSDTSGISALIQIGRLNLLQKLFQEIIIPAKVHDELLQLNNFGVDLSAFRQAGWIKVLEPKPTDLLNELLLTLHEGESQAIALAIELNADLLILDDGDARKEATRLSLQFTGIAGILVRAKAKSLIAEVRPVLDEMIAQANFRLQAQTYKMILDLAGEQV
ncbi:MAG: DUF3368 domain-containing protein [Saprospiraceae bacterium]|nr:DUF3368 domain-containing protein [Saprospiraceae bacterium]